MRRGREWGDGTTGFSLLPTCYARDARAGLGPAWNADQVDSTVGRAALCVVPYPQSPIPAPPLSELHFWVSASCLTGPLSHHQPPKVQKPKHFRWIMWTSIPGSDQLVTQKKAGSTAEIFVLNRWILFLKLPWRMFWYRPLGFESCRKPTTCCCSSSWTKLLKVRTSWVRTARCQHARSWEVTAKKYNLSSTLIIILSILEKSLKFLLCSIEVEPINLIRWPKTIIN